jgi:hypothetical protein
LIYVYNHEIEKLKEYIDIQEAIHYIENHPANQLTILQIHDKLPKPISGFLDVAKDFHLITTEEDMDEALIKDIPLIYISNLS